MANLNQRSHHDLILIFLCVTAGSVFSKKEKLSTEIMVDEFRNCDKPSVNTITNANIMMVGRGITVINLDFIVTKPIADGKFVIIIDKCTVECERFMKYGIDFCDIVTQKGMPWSYFLESSHPKLRCPLNKGTYKFINGTLNAGAVSNLGSAFPLDWLEKFHWKSTFQVLAKNGENLGCGFAKVKFVRVKRKH